MPNSGKQRNTADEDCAHIHVHHDHQHGETCGCKSVKHGDHVDYVHDGHLHRIHGNHMDECDGPQENANT